MNEPQRNPQMPPPGGGNRNSRWPLVGWGIVLVLMLAYWFSTQHAQRLQPISYTQFKQAVRNDKVSKVLMHGDQVRGLYKKGASVTVQSSGATNQSSSKSGAAPGKGSTQTGKAQKPKGFVTTLPPVNDPSLMKLLQEHHVSLTAESTQTPWWEQALVGLLPWVLLIGIFWYASYKMQQRMSGFGGQGGPFGFMKSRAKRYHRSLSRVTFDDVAGQENAKRDAQEMVAYLKDPQRYKALGANIPKGVLLMGPPGVGKTLLARAIAGEADVPFYSISASEFIEMFVGVGASRVRDMFESAKKEAPAIIFIDELDAIGRARGAGLGGGHDEREQTLNQILSEMDGFSSDEQVVVFAATNRPDVLDPALLRPGRFDRKLTLELPQRRARYSILEVHARKVPLADDVKLDAIAARTVGFSGADLRNLVNEASLYAARSNKQRVDAESFDRARDKIVLGARREEMLSDEDKRLVAYHESGHAMMAALLPSADPLDRVTIIPRGRALGATEQTPEEDRVNVRESYLRDRLAVMLGGRGAEELVFGEYSSGAENDLKEATHLARRMICRWGMNEGLGPVSFPRGEDHIFLGREMAHPPDFSEHTAQLIDDEIRKLLVSTEERVRDTLRHHRQGLDALAEALLQHETLEAKAIEELLRNAAA